MITKEQYQAKVRENSFKAAVENAARILGRDIQDTRYEMMPFGSVAQHRSIQRKLAWNKLATEIYLAKNS